jgi:hypothetical protein
VCHAASRALTWYKVQSAATARGHGRRQFGIMCIIVCVSVCVLFLEAALGRDWLVRARVSFSPLSCVLVGCVFDSCRKKPRPLQTA